MYCCLLFWNIWLSKYSWTIKSLSPQAFKANASSSGVELIKSISVALLWSFCRICENITQKEAVAMGQLRPSWVFVPILHCQLLWQFSTTSICALPLCGFVDFQIQDLWISTARGFVRRFISCGGGGVVSHTASAVSLNIHEYLPWIFVNKQHEYSRVFAMNIC